ncbi:MAG TPA: efflux RND transporter periplasmic adaptor subunit [Bryobacteraceae bacterium]|nr:efflux RND transporter periplasmic adaptor subunit [Bryobacteraceae bacterium]
MIQELEPQTAPVEAPAEQVVSPRARKLGRALLILAGGFVLAVVALIVMPGLRERRAAAKGLVAVAQAGAVSPVNVVYPKPGSTADELVLPANVQAYTDAPIYARTHGYLKRWYFDIGAHVKQGQLLAEIDTPEVDQQLEQARADLKSVQANMELAHTTAVRWQNLLEKHAVSKQETDQAVSDYTSKQAAADASAANVRRLEQLQSYEKVYAPFDGVITARQTDVGALIDGDSSPKELFHLASIDKLRVFVPVPETDSSAVREGEVVTITSDQFPNQKFRGTLVRNSSAIDPSSRTLNVEVDVDNASGKLLPGSYAFVHLRAPNTTGGLIIPSTTLLFRAQGLQVGVVKGDRATLAPITIGHDYGATVEVTSGLTRRDAVILSPSDSLADGAPVRIEKGER